MKINSCKRIFLCCFTLLIIFIPLKIINALSLDWVGVPKSQYGEQLWDKNSIQKNDDDSIRLISKFIPKNNIEFTKDILCAMDIQCSRHTLRDVAVGAKEFNEFQNKDSQ